MTTEQTKNYPLDPPCILTLDLGSQLGWAMRLSEGTFSSGTISFKPGRFEGAGMGFMRFRHWLEEMHKTSGGINLLYFEEVRAHAGTLAAQVYGGFVAHLTAWCEWREVPYQGVPVATIKKHATGKGNGDKQSVIAAMQAKGFEPHDDNEADALAILHWAISQGGMQ